MRRLGLAALVLFGACRAPTAESRWLDEPPFRRAALERSLEEDTAYARLRRSQWAAWQSLPEWSPIEVSLAARSGDRVALAALGREAFFHYPVQRAPEGAREEGHGMQHLARVGEQTHLTCATCHTHEGVVGAPNRDLDLGAALVDAHPNAPAEARAVALSWGKGRADVSSTTGSEPARIPDLRPVRWQRSLQWSGAVRQHDVTSLAARIETLIITSEPTRRPPPAIALGLAIFLHGLSDALPPAPPNAVFAKHCSECHEGPGLSGGLVDVDEVGTDPGLARSLERGTGSYRVPSLRGVGTRGALMHDGSIVDLEVLLDPSRAGGHRYGLELTVAERGQLLAWLRGL